MQISGRDPAGGAQASHAGAAAARAPAICTPTPGFDRDAFHAALNREVVRFFSDKLRPTRTR